MAITATIALDRSVTQRNQKVRAVLTVSNSDGTNAVTVLNVVPFVESASSPNPSATNAIGQVVAGVVIPPSGSNTLVWDTMLEAGNPTGNYDSPPSQNAYHIGCLVYCDDGSVTSPTVQAVTIRPASNYGS